MWRTSTADAIAPRAMEPPPMANLRIEPDATPVRKVYTNRMTFKLPIKVDHPEGAALREVQLFGCNGPGTPWSCRRGSTAG